MIKKLATIGNSFGVIIDRPLLREAGIEPESRIELIVEGGSVIIRAAPPGARKPRRSVPARRKPVADVGSV